VYLRATFGGLSTGSILAGSLAVWYNSLMPSGIVATNTCVQFVIGQLRNQLNADHSLRLFSNNYIPGPNSTFVDFAESSFPGYARWNLNGVFAPQIKIQEGEWATISPTHVFTCTGASSEAVFGWYIVNQGLVRYAYRFPELVSLGTGIEVAVKVTLESWALWLLQ